MFKYQITNDSGAADPSLGRPIFITEVGKLLQPGEACPTNRLNGGTRETPGLRVAEGDFPPLPAPKKKPQPKGNFDDEDDEPVKAKKVDDGPVGFVDVKTKKRSNIVPLKAVGADDETTKEAEVTAASERDDDELDGIIPKATRTSAADESGFVDIKLPKSGGVSLAR